MTTTLVQPVARPEASFDTSLADDDHVRGWQARPIEMAEAHGPMVGHSSTGSARGFGRAQLFCHEFDNFEGVVRRALTLVLENLGDVL